MNDKSPFSRMRDAADPLNLAGIIKARRGELPQRVMEAQGEIRGGRFVSGWMHRVERLYAKHTRPFYFK